MKKILLNIFRNIEQKNKAQLILELLTVESTIEESVTLYNKVKADFMYKMAQEKERLRKETILIDGIKDIKPYNSDFDKPLSQVERDFANTVETNYELIKPN